MTTEDENNEETEDKDSNELKRIIAELWDIMLWSILQEDDSSFNSDKSSDQDNEEVTEAMQKEKAKGLTIINIKE